MAKVNPWEKIARAREFDIQIARLMQDEPTRYPGLMQEWARRVIENERLAPPSIK